MEYTVRKVEQAGQAIASVSLAAIMLVVSLDALMRYAIKAPQQWANEVVSYYLLVLAAYMPLAATFQRGDHININLLHRRLPAMLRVWLEILTCVLAAIVFALIAGFTTSDLLEAYHNREFKPGYLPWPAWLSLAPIPVGATVLCLRLLHHILCLWRWGHDPNVVDGSEGGVE